MPKAPQSIQKGVSLKLVLDRPAVSQLAHNLNVVHHDFQSQAFVNEVMAVIPDLSLKERGLRIAQILRKYLPNNYSQAIDVLLASLTPPLLETTNLGLSGMFYLPHVSFVEQFGLDTEYNQGQDPFAVSMKAQYELTQRFSAEFSIRAFIINDLERTYRMLHQWIHDPNPHVRRLCSEGTRPRLPWAQKIASLVADPSPSIAILEKLKNDEDLYVRRSVANHVGDIAKDHLDLALKLCADWLPKASNELKWVIRHALRHPAKKGVARALEIRKSAK